MVVDAEAGAMKAIPVVGNAGACGTKFSLKAILITVGVVVCTGIALGVGLGLGLKKDTVCPANGVACTSGVLCYSALPSTAATGSTPVLHSAFTYTAQSQYPVLFNDNLTAADKVPLLTGSQCASKVWVNLDASPAPAAPLNPAYTVCADYPSLFSSLALSPRSCGNELRFIGSSDRGPNGDCPTTSAAGINKNRHKSFLSPNFVPFIVEMKANTGNSKLEVTGSCLLRLESGRKLSGLPNHFDYASAPTGYPTYADIAADSQCLALTSTTPSTNAALMMWSGTAGLDVHGLDLEDIAPLGNGLCAGVDEYGPSIVIFNCDFGSSACGTVLKRYVPANKLSLYQNAASASEKAYFSGILPAIFSKRRGNRGLESVAVSPDGKTLMALLQSPLGPKNDGSSADPNTQYSIVLTAVELDVSAPLDAKVKGVYLMVADDGNPGTGFTPATGSYPGEPKDIKASGFAWAAQHVPGVDPNAKILIVDERRDGSSVYEVHVNLVDFTGATDIRPFLTDTSDATLLQFDLAAQTIISSASDADRLDTSKVAQKLIDLGVKPAKKAQLMTTGAINPPATITAGNKVEGWGDTNPKQEGVLLINNCMLATGDDNDFTIGGTANTPVKLNFVRLKTCVSDAYKLLAY